VAAVIQVENAPSGVRPYAQDAQHAEALWAKSEEMVGNSSRWLSHLSHSARLKAPLNRPIVLLANTLALAYLPFWFSSDILTKT
jgi:hypothetical protein